MAPASLASVIVQATDHSFSSIHLSNSSPSPSARKRLSAEDRRAALLDAALDVFARRGYHAASIDEIAQAAGISKALIYEHFPSKKDLHVSLLERHTQEIFEALAAAAATSEPGRVRLRAGVDAFFEWVETHRKAFRLLFRDVFEADVAEVLARLQSQATATIAALIAAEPLPAHQAQAERRELSIETLAQLLSGAVQSLAIWWQENPAVEREFLVERVMDFAWTGLERVSLGEESRS
ncbi:MAG: TetR/AcrR family transcriptional regulator [Thermoleophilaceae bacterium]